MKVTVPQFDFKFNIIHVTMNMKEFLEEQHNEQVRRAIEMALKFKFPGIKDLVVSDGVIRFEDDGIHTIEEVNKFLDELKSYKP